MSNGTLKQIYVQHIGLSDSEQIYNISTTLMRYKGES